MIKQNKYSYSTLVTSLSKATIHISKLSIAASDAGLFPRLYRILYGTLGTSHRSLKFWLKANLEGQVASSEEYFKEGSSVHPYNFLFTPQSLFLSPHSYRNSKLTTQTPDNTTQLKQNTTLSV
jgi:hypothetical protein